MKTKHMHGATEECFYKEKPEGKCFDDQQIDGVTQEELHKRLFRDPGGIRTDNDEQTFDEVTSPSHLSVEPEFEFPVLPTEARLPEELGADACPWLDTYIEFSRKWSPRSFDGFHEATALWILSTIAARRVSFHFGKPRFTNLYLMLGGRTTLHAKSSCTEIGRQTLNACGLDFFLAPDESTPQSFVKYLSADLGFPSDFDHLPKEAQEQIMMRVAFKGQIGWYAEEFGSWLSSMMRTDGIMAEFRGLLRRFDDCPEVYSRSTITRSLETVERPYLALIANLTPADLKPLARKGTQLWGDGFLARFAFITPPLDEVLPGRFPRGERVIPEEITIPLIEWHTHLVVPEVTHSGSKIPGLDEDRERGTKVDVKYPPTQVLKLSDSVYETFYIYQDALLEITRGCLQTDLDGNYGRLGEKALRIAALFASFSKDDEIQLRHWARAQEIVERWRVYTHRLYSQVTVGEMSDNSQKEDLILGVLKRHAGSEKYPDGMTSAEIARFMHGMGRIEVDSYVKKLYEIDVVQAKRVKRATRYSLVQED